MIYNILFKINCTRDLNNCLVVVQYFFIGHDIVEISIMLDKCFKIQLNVCLLVLTSQQNFFRVTTIGSKGYTFFALDVFLIFAFILCHYSHMHFVVFVIWLTNTIIISFIYLLLLLFALQKHLESVILLSLNHVWYSVWIL